MKLLKFTFLISILLFVDHISSAQVLKSFGNKLKEKVTTTLNDGGDEAIIAAAINQMQKSHAKRDSSAMSLILSSYDQVSIYSDRKKVAGALRGFTNLMAEINDHDYEKGTSLNPFKKESADPYGGLTKEEFQLLKKAESLNQTGELSYSGRYFKYAQNSFLGAELKLYGNAKLENSLLNAKIKSNLGMLYHSLGDFNAAEEQFGKAYTVLENMGNSSKYQLAVTLNNESVLLKDLGKFNEAERKQKEAIGILEEIDKKGGALAIALNNLAILYQYLGRVDEGIQILERIIQGNEANWNEKSNTYQRININLALIYEEAGRTSDAEKIYLSALKLKEKQNRTKQPDYAAILTNLSALYLNSGQFDKNIGEKLKKAKNVYTNAYGDSHPTIMSVLKVKGLWQLKTDKKAEGLATLTKNYKLSREIYGVGHPKVNESRILMAYAKWLNGDNEGAKKEFEQSLNNNIEYIQTYFPAMSEVEKSKYWQTLQRDFHTYYAFVVDQPSDELIKKMLEYEVVVKGLMLSTSGKIRRQILSSNNRRLISKYEDWKSSKTLLAYYYTLSAEELNSQGANIDSVAQAANSQERWLSANSDAFKAGQSSEQISATQLQSKLTGGEALIDIIKYYNPKKSKNVYAAIIVKPASTDIVEIGDEETLDGKAIKLYKNAIIYKQAESKSYFSFWNNIDAKLLNSKKLFVVKDGVFNQVSLGSLNDGNQYVADRYDISILTNPMELVNVKESSENISNLFLMGSPAFDLNKYTALPGTAEEINSIAGLAKQKGLAVDKYLEANASELNFEKSANYSVLHVATHGFFVEKKKGKGKLSGEQVLSSNALDALMRSGLVLADEGASSGDLGSTEDGLATAYEISSLDFPNTEIVILSACETGLGEIQTGEGVYGLQRSFLVAGASSVIMSLWKVDDAATKDFMVTFYKQWFATKDKHKAFNMAKRAIKDQYSDPYYWGAFVLIEG